MTAADSAPSLDGVGEAFTGAPATRWLLPTLRRLPPVLVREVMAALAVGDGVVRRGRFRRSRAWARAQGQGGWQGMRLAVATLANHGRYVAQEAMVGLIDGDRLRQLSRIDGAAHLDGRHRGALLLGLHLGPPRSWLYLRAHGYPVCFVIRDTAGRGPLWDQWRREGVVLPLSLGDAAAARVQSLYRIRRRLHEGHLVFMTADGPLGPALFTLNLPGAALPIRTGWFQLRRQLQVPTLPTLVHETGGRRIVTVYPPLPPTDDDAGRDADRCREVLTSIVRDYVRRYPAQCRYLAFPPWS